mmetsp:Transcript_46637/g.123163  ORF Transcript_46637/g.123163 Transcript_46637/m.123163 type:complete len:231 (+) Transcript_46637:296-988(+)
MFAAERTPNMGDVMQKSFGNLLSLLHGSGRDHSSQAPSTLQSGDSSERLTVIVGGAGGIAGDAIGPCAGERLPCAGLGIWIGLREGDGMGPSIGDGVGVLPQGLRASTGTSFGVPIGTSFGVPVGRTETTAALGAPPVSAAASALPRDGTNSLALGFQPPISPLFSLFWTLTPSPLSPPIWAAAAWAHASAVHSPSPPVHCCHWAAPGSFEIASEFSPAPSLFSPAAGTM